MLFAHVLEDGSIEEGGPGGITQENVRRVITLVETDQDLDSDGVLDTREDVKYCLSGLPPLFGGNVTIEFAELAPPLTFPYIQVNTTDSACSPVVRLVQDGFARGIVTSSGRFHVLLY